MWEENSLIVVVTQRLLQKVAHALSNSRAMEVSVIMAEITITKIINLEEEIMEKKSFFAGVATTLVGAVVIKFADNKFKICEKFKKAVNEAKEKYKSEKEEESQEQEA